MCCKFTQRNFRKVTHQRTHIRSVDYGRDLKSWDNLRRIWEGEKGWKENWHALLAVHNWLQRIIWNRPWVRNSSADRLWFWALIQFHQYFAFKLSCQEFKGTLFWCRYSLSFVMLYWTQILPKTKVDLQHFYLKSYITISYLDS